MNAPAPPTAERGRVLIADDQPAVLDALRLLLKINGYEVQTVRSPAAVLSALAEGARPFDLLLLDLNYARDTTSGQEGLELVTRVHARDPQLPIVAMTAWSSVPLAVATLREGGADFVEKPWDNDRLLAAVGAHIESGRRRRRARRLEADALAVQRRLLDRGLPEVEGFELGVAWTFAESLGGDVFAAAPRPGGRLAVAIGDVCGKGTPAALLMASVQANLEELLDGPLPPGEICRRLGRSLHPRLGPDRFVSFACAVLDPARGVLSYANAGHPAPLLQGQRSGPRRLETGGPVLGVVADAAYDEGRLPLAPGDRLVMVTDGVTEASRAAAGEELGEGRLIEGMRALAALPAAAASAAVLEEARRFAGGTLADDATVLVTDVRRPG
jgi:phosphoserine phosphatase RsbU/P